MATLYIRWFARLAKGGDGGVIAAGDESGQTSDETVTLSATSAQSGEAPDWARFAELHVDTAAHYAVSSNPTATTSNMRMPAGLTIFKGVKSGLKVAARTS